MKFLDRVFGERTARARGLAERARALLEKGQNERAQEDLVKALRLDPDSPEARELYAGLLCRRGLIRWTDGDWPGAVAEFTRSLKVVQNPIVMFHRGLVHKEAREYLKAIEDLSKVVRTEDPRSIPYLVWALAARAECYQEMGEVKGALKDYQVCIEQRAGGPSAYRYLFKCAGLEKQLGNAARAEELCARALEMRPGFKPAEVLRAALLGKNQEKIHHRDTEKVKPEGEEKPDRKEEVKGAAVAVAPAIPVAATPVAVVVPAVVPGVVARVERPSPEPIVAPRSAPIPSHAADRVVETRITRESSEGVTRRLAAQSSQGAEARAQKRTTTRVMESPAVEQVSFWERNAIPRPAREEIAEPTAVIAPAVAASAEVPAVSSPVAAAVAEAPVVAPAPIRETPEALGAAVPSAALPVQPSTLEERLLGRVGDLLRRFEGGGGPALDDSIDLLILADQLRVRAVKQNAHADLVRRAEARAREVVAAHSLVPFVRELSDEAGQLLARSNDEIVHDRVSRNRARVLVRRFAKLSRAERFLFFESCGADRFSRFSTLVELADAGRLA